jgi:hypothetical protein
LNPLGKVESSTLSSKMKRSIGLRMKNLTESIAKVEHESGLRYPPYFVNPVLTLVPSSDNMIDGIGVFYARTIPIPFQGKIQIVVEFSAPLVLYATKKTMQLVVAHELLHYVELVKNFTSMSVISQITPSSIFEERYTDSSRGIDPALVFKNKRLVKELMKRASAGLDDQKLNEKCRIRWIEKALPMEKLPLGSNQVIISAESILSADFDPRLKEILSTIKSNN